MAEQIIRLCEVQSVDDPTDGNRIRVRLTPEDNDVSDDKLPYAIPLLPQIFHVKPKEKEAVLILTALGNNNYTQRYYIGPVISQINHIQEESFLEASKNFTQANAELDPAITRDVNETKGALANPEDVAIYGRKNSDIILTEDDLRIRCGCKKVNETNKRDFKFNDESPAYIKLKTFKENLTEGTTSGRCESGVVIVADKINLIGNDSKEHFETNNPDELTTDETFKKMLETAHELPYGDKLVQFLDLFRTAFIEHTHPFPGFKACQVDSYNDTNNYDLNSILSDSVRIN